jgi:HK97 family phage major capsid protein
MDPIEALNKAVDPISISGPGKNLRDTPDADSFRGQMGALGTNMLTDIERQFVLDTVVDESVLMNEVRKYQMNRPIVEIPRMTLGSKILQSHKAGGHPESREGDDVKPGWSAMEMVASKLVLPWSITEEFLEDNPDGGRAEEIIARAMSTQVANDLEDLAINGDESLTGDRLYQANDGFLALHAAVADAPRLALGGAAFTTGVFDAMLRSLKTKYRRNKRNLRFYVGPDIHDDFVQAIASRQGAMADQFLTGMLGDPTFGGIPIRMVPTMPDGTAILTDPKNLVFGVYREMRLKKTNEGFNALRRDERYYMLTMRVDFMIEDAEAMVVATGIGPRDE